MATWPHERPEPLFASQRLLLDYELLVNINGHPNLMLQFFQSSRAMEKNKNKNPSWCHDYKGTLTPS